MSWIMCPSVHATKDLKVIRSCNANQSYAMNQRQPEISAVNNHADRMPNALAMSVDVSSSIKEIRTKDADRSAQQIPNVVEIEPACATNASIHVLEHAARIRYAKLWIISQFVLVQLDIQAIRSHSVVLKLLHRRQTLTYAIHHRAG